MISVIIATYKRKDLLFFAIERLLKQKNVEIEIIVINDNIENDPTDEIVDKYPQVIYVKYPQKVGPGKKHQIGFSLSHGEYINFHDDDDYLCDDLFFEKASTILNSDNSLAFVSGNAYRKYEDLPTEQQFKKKELNVKGKMNRMDYLSKFQIGYDKPSSTFPTIFRRTTLERQNFNEQIEMNDSSIYMLALLGGDAYFMEDFVGVYRVHSQSITRKGFDLNWRLRVFAQKEYILGQIKNEIKNPGEWWQGQFCLTYRYFAKSTSRKEKIMLLKWGLIHHHSYHLSLRIIIELFKVILFNRFLGRLQKTIKYFFKQPRLGFRKLMNTLYVLTRNSNNIIIINSWIKQRDNHIVLPNNFGDDLNFYLIHSLTGKKVVHFKTIFHIKENTENFSCIGSILEKETNSKTVIWGTGAMYGGDFCMKAIPKRICSVRGPRTRTYLLSKGIACPKLYGDPALLLPLVYSTTKTKTHKVGIIPNWRELNDEKVKDIVQDKDVTIINFHDYSKWTDVIDQIVSCECIASSSLHGLIISDAYHVPNVWIKLTDKIIGSSFKYLDYFESIERDTIEPLDYTNKNIDLSEIYSKVKKHTIPKSIIKDLLQSCPFELLPEFHHIEKTI